MSEINTLGIGMSHDEHDERGALNTDRELWRETEGDYYAPSIHVTKDGGIGIHCDGRVIVMPIRKWAELARGAARPASDVVIEGATNAVLRAEKRRRLNPQELPYAVLTWRAAERHHGIGTDEASRQPAARKATAPAELVEAQYDACMEAIRAIFELDSTGKARLRSVGGIPMGLSPKEERMVRALLMRGEP